ncbi:BON domain-containing protein [Chromobacterium paludis]|uniref:BON domain-containing protein n=1 Tax=Chromobacterium paludis TaxID=2605945 RepID=A0A5C1DI61_9NEIS|nr:BON domain-containing protein [Chromobacterium paludis]QEL56456.1 BON domain-containing protein [Chromobacterium paludis]
MKQVASRILMLAALSLSGVFAAHAAYADEAAVAAPTDEQLVVSVKQALDADSELKALDLKVSSKKGEVTIEGMMNDDQQMFKAGQIAEKVPGVKFVINNMQAKS